VGWTCCFNYVFIHFFDGFIVNYRFASAFIPESKSDVNVGGSKRGGSGVARQMFPAHRYQADWQVEESVAQPYEQCTGWKPWPEGSCPKGKGAGGLSPGFQPWAPENKRFALKLKGRQIESTNNAKVS
jgi:hypothetical protein